MRHDLRPLTKKFSDALDLARHLHRDQRRRGMDAPYLAHLLGVCAIVLNEGGTENQAIAALLHDAVEDHADEISFENIGMQFGPVVEQIVKAATEPLPEKSSQKISWLDQKMRYVEHIRQAPEIAKLVILADKVDNARQLKFAEHRWGDAYWSRFKSPTQDDMRRYQVLLRAALEGWEPAALFHEFKQLLS